MKNSFVNISEVNRQCLHSLGTRSEDDFEKVSSTTLNTLYFLKLSKILYFNSIARFSLSLAMRYVLTGISRKSSNTVKVETFAPVESK